MNPTKIEWCDRSWNPVTGCLNTCPYCYARGIACRFGGADITDYSKTVPSINTYFSNSQIHELNEPVIDTSTRRIAPYPFGFDPTFHVYRLNEPSQIKKPQNIFVCSMADLFGDWIPDEWIEKVFEACLKLPQHRYLFLTKNPYRYKLLFGDNKTPDNFWLGTTITTELDLCYWSGNKNTFLSVEPIMCRINFNVRKRTNPIAKWVIIGAETGNRKDKIIPRKEWIENIVNYCREKNVPVFMKSSLKEIWGDELIQEYPWDKEKE